MTREAPDPNRRIDHDRAIDASHAIRAIGPVHRSPLEVSP
jgi:hypothetical protein